MCNRSTTRTGRSSNHGFTLVEIIIAVVIVGILASVTLVAVRRASDNAQLSACGADRQALELAIDVWTVDHPDRIDVTEAELVDLRLITAESDLHEVVDANTITPTSACVSDVPALSTSTSVIVAATTIPATSIPATTIATTSTTIAQPGTWLVVQNQPPAIVGSSVHYTSYGSVINGTPAGVDGTISVTAAVTAGNGYGIWFRTTVVAGALVGGYTLQWDLGYRTGPDAAPNLLVRKWGIAPGGSFSECNVPVANIPIPADLRNADPHRVTIQLNGVVFVASVDGREVLRVNDLTAAANKVCAAKPLPSGTLFGYRVWSGSSDVTFTSPSFS